MNWRGKRQTKREGYTYTQAEVGVGNRKKLRLNRKKVGLRSSELLVNLRQLVVSFGLYGVGLFVGMSIAERVTSINGLKLAIALAVVLLVILTGSWPIYRLFSIRPIGLPMCPHCGRMHGDYNLPRYVWPVAVLFCDHCGKPLRLVLGGPPYQKDRRGIPTASLYHPKFLGLWRYEEDGSPVRTSGEVSCPSGKGA